MARKSSCHLFDMLAEVPDPRNNNRVISGLFSFKNFQLMSVTESLYCRLGRAIAKPNKYTQMLGFAIALPNLQYYDKH